MHGNLRDYLFLISATVLSSCSSFIIPSSGDTLHVLFCSGPFYPIKQLMLLAIDRLYSSINSLPDTRASLFFDPCLLITDLWFVLVPYSGKITKNTLPVKVHEDLKWYSHIYWSNTFWCRAHSRINKLTFKYKLFFSSPLDAALEEFLCCSISNQLVNRGLCRLL